VTWIQRETRSACLTGFPQPLIAQWNDSHTRRRESAPHRQVRQSIVHRRRHESASWLGAAPCQGALIVAEPRWLIQCVLVGGRSREWPGVGRRRSVAVKVWSPAWMEMRWAVCRRLSTISSRDLSGSACLFAGP
jgi:hypothetical protein